MPIAGANPAVIHGPGVLIHEGGDPILVAEIVDGLPDIERSLHFEGSEQMVDGEGEFVPSSTAARSTEIGKVAHVRALGQANYSLDQIEAPEGPAISPAAEKLAAEHGLEPTDIEYDGIKITVPDVKRALESVPA